MQNAKDLLTSIAQQGVRLWVENGQLRFRATKGSLHPEQIAALRAARMDLIELLEQVQSPDDVPLRPRAPHTPIPLVGLQTKAWKHLTKPDALPSRRGIVDAMHIVGPLDIPLLRASMEEVIRRHESLRTTISAVDGIPRQIVHADYGCHIDVVDLSSVSKETAFLEVVNLCESFIDQPVDLSVGPLLAVKVFALSPLEHILVLALDHMITDGTSNEILRRELWSLYAHANNATESSLPNLPIQLGDYAVWQNVVDKAWRRLNERYWITRLSGTPCVDIPVDGGSVQADSPPIGARIQIPFREALTEKLRETARATNTLLALVVLAVYVVLIWRWCSRSDLVVVFVMNGRFRPELENVIGWLATHLHLRIEVDKGETFIDLLNRVNLEFRVACAHMDFDRVPLLMPDFSTELYFNWLNLHGSPSAIHPYASDDLPLKVQRFPLQGKPGATKFNCFFADSPAGIFAGIQYRPDLLSQDVIKRLGEELRSLGWWLATHPTQRLATL